MKSPIILLLALLSFSLSCSGGGSARTATNSPVGVADRKDAEPVEAAQDVAKLQRNDSVQQQKVALTEVDRVGATGEAFERKIIRNAEITMEVASTTDTQHKITSSRTES